MRRLLTSHSLLSQIVALGGVTILLTLLSVLMVTGAPAATSGGQAVRLVLAVMGYVEWRRSLVRRAAA